MTTEDQVVSTLKRVKKGWYGRTLEGLALLGVAGSFVPLCFYGRLAGVRLPIHYNLQGQADGWGGREFLWSLPLLAVGFYVALSVAERLPRLFHYPVKVTPANADALWVLAVGLLRHLKCLVTLLFAYIGLSSLFLALGRTAGPNEAVMMAFTAGLFLVFGYFLLKMTALKDR